MLVIQEVFVLHNKDENKKNVVVILYL